ncbi:hypothetical protein PHYPSEUDO_014704 [Phytophthora pseudosyringae]|uniref:Uncharacterized protein n=1 Tax=Phytophthora pseudosyringae TaxID=221518 RepID=A0A8T1V3Z0_9STRA|nr:hypothetical protein PHYPSEUDO_014704 [Phytophthora pseudosyringae]
MECSSRNRRSSDPFGKPSELLQEIGLRGKEVVRILKDRNWEVRDPKALQEHKLYYVPGGRSKGDLAIQGEDFFVGEGELYAYILGHGGLSFLLPDEGWSTETKMDSESDFEILDHPPLRIDPAQQKVSATETPSATSAPQQPKRKRRKKLSTNSDGKTSARATPATPKPRKNASAIAECRVKEEKIPFVAADGCRRFVEFGAYEAALTARGWRAQLLQDIDLHLLRSVAAIARRQVALEATGGDQKVFSGPSEGSRPHEGVRQKLKMLSSGITASQNDLSAMIAAIIGQAERAQSPDRVECAARIGVPGFVSTGSGNLVLLRDMERHVLHLVAAVRQYLRARDMPDCARGEVSTAKRQDLRALQLNIEKMNAELTKVAAIVGAQAENLSRGNAATTPMELDADVETDSEQ